MPKTKDATRILDQMTGDDQELQQMIADETLNAEVARLIYEARTTAELTQAELAELIGTQYIYVVRGFQHVFEVVVLGREEGQELGENGHQDHHDDDREPARSQWLLANQIYGDLMPCLLLGKFSEVVVDLNFRCSGHTKCP